MSEPILPSEPVAAQSAADIAPSTSTPPRTRVTGSSAHATLRSPFLTLWAHPRWTIQDVVAERPAQFVLLLMALTSFAHFDSELLTSAASDDVGGVVATCVGLMMLPLVGFVILAARGFIAAHVGSWLGGTASALQVRAALAWAWLPFVAVFLLRIPHIAAVVALSIDAPAASSTWPVVASAIRAGYASAEAPIALLLAIAVLWSVVLEIVLLSEVHGINKRRALLVDSASVVLPIVAAVVAFSVFEAAR